MTKGVPKRNGSGKGVGSNKGRGGCSPPRNTNARSRCVGRGRGR